MRDVVLSSVVGGVLRYLSFSLTSLTDSERTMDIYFGLVSCECSSSGSMLCALKGFLTAIGVRRDGPLDATAFFDVFLLWELSSRELLECRFC